MVDALVVVANAGTPEASSSAEPASRTSRRETLNGWLSVIVDARCLGLRLWFGSSDSAVNTVALA